MLQVNIEMSHSPLRNWYRFVAVFPLLCCSAIAVAEADNHARELQGEVVGIADGDTLTLLVDDTTYRIRLAEIDAPEGGQAWGNRARQALADKVFRQQVRVSVVDIDQYGRQVGKVWLQDRDINRELISEGHAWVYRKYLTDRSLLENEAAAKASASGLWSQSEAVPPWQWRHNGQLQSTTRQPAGTSAEDGNCRIKGNISSNGQKIYHVPGQRYYPQTQISESRGERWFCSEGQARKAGWRRSKV